MSNQKHEMRKSPEVTEEYPLTFPEALSALRELKKVRNYSWADGVYVQNEVITRGKKTYQGSYMYGLAGGRVQFKVNLEGNLEYDGWKILPDTAQERVASTKDGDVVEMKAEEAKHVKPDTVKQEEGQPCLLEKCQWYMSKTNSCDIEAANCMRIRPESEANMDFSEALKALKMGSKVKRVGWAGGLCMYLYEDCIVYGDSGCDKLSFADNLSDEDLLATDWMLHIE